jgi:SnoaL-like domain
MPPVESARDLFVVPHRNYANGPILESRGSAIVSGVTTTLDCGERQTIQYVLLPLNIGRRDMHVRRPLAIPTLLVAAAVFCVAAAQIAEQGTDEPIRTARDRWNRAVEKRDTAAFRSLLTDT